MNAKNIEGSGVKQGGPTLLCGLRGSTPVSGLSQ